MIKGGAMEQLAWFDCGNGDGNIVRKMKEARVGRTDRAKKLNNSF